MVKKKLFITHIWCFDPHIWLFTFLSPYMVIWWLKEKKLLRNYNHQPTGVFVSTAQPRNCILETSRLRNISQPPKTSGRAPRDEQRKWTRPKDVTKFLVRQLYMFTSCSGNIYIYMYVYIYMYIYIYIYIIVSCLILHVGSTHFAEAWIDVSVLLPNIQRKVSWFNFTPVSIAKLSRNVLQAVPIEIRFEPLKVSSTMFNSDLK